MLKSKTIRVADVIITSQTTGEILRGQVIDTGNRIKGIVNNYNFSQPILVSVSLSQIRTIETQN